MILNRVRFAAEAELPGRFRRVVAPLLGDLQRLDSCRDGLFRRMMLSETFNTNAVEMVGFNRDPAWLLKGQTSDWWTVGGQRIE